MSKTSDNNTSDHTLSTNDLKLMMCLIFCDGNDLLKIHSVMWTVN